MKTIYDTTSRRDGSLGSPASLPTTAPRRGATWRGVMAAVVAAVCVIVAGCGGGHSALLGKWELDVDALTINKLDDVAGKFELLKDGKGIVESTPITWKIENNRLYLTSLFRAISYRYELTNTNLKLIDDNGKVIPYKKK